MKKYVIGFLATLAAFLMISSATAVPNVNSENIKNKTIEIEKPKLNLKEKIDDLNLLEIKTEGIFDWLIELIKTIIQLVYNLIQIVYDLIRIVNLIERLINAIEILIGLIQYLIELITDLIPSQKMIA